MARRTQKKRGARRHRTLRRGAGFFDSFFGTPSTGQGAYLTGVPKPSPLSSTPPPNEPKPPAETGEHLNPFNQGFGGRKRRGRGGKKSRRR
jgi:hypothetical protein